MLIDSLMQDDGASIYYDEDFRNVLEDHMTYLRALSSTTTLALDVGKVYKYEHDLFGLLADYGIPMQLHWVVMRLNKMSTPTDLRQDQTALLIPDASVVDKIRQSHMSSRKLT